MKFFLLLIVLCLPLLALSNEETKLVKEIRAFYDEIDHSGMKTDYLFNRGFVVLNNLEEWKNGMPVIANFNKWKYIFSSIQNSNLSETTFNLEKEDFQFQNYYSETEQCQKVEMALLFYKGDYISSNQVKGLYTNNLPPEYQPMNIFSGTVLTRKVYNDTVTFYINPSNYYSNMDKKCRISVDFSDHHGFRPIDFNSPQNFQIVYDCKGEKSITFLLETTNDTLTSFTTINIVSTNQLPKSKINTIKMDDDSTDNFKSDPGIYVHYLSYLYEEGVDGVLDKPVFITEGFDIVGTDALSDLKSRWTNRISTLKNHGYDIFYINFDSPTRSLVDNAEDIAQFIYKVNQAKTGNFEGIYIGESMGGIVGRIALKIMEDDGEDHQVGLFVPYDSPFKGAFVPLGMQWLLDIVYDELGVLAFVGTGIVDMYEAIFGEDVAYADIYSQYNSDAARQMLIYHNQGNGIHQSFQSYLEGLGYPTNSRNVAVVNGSNDGDMLSLKPTDKYYIDETILWGLVNYGFKGKYKENGTNNDTLARYFEAIFPRFPDIDGLVVDSDNIAFAEVPGSYISANALNKDIKFTFVPSLSAIDINSSYFQYPFNYNFSDPTYIIENNLTPFDNIICRNYSTQHISHSSYLTDLVNIQEVMPINMYLQNRVINNVRDFEANSDILIGNYELPTDWSKHQEHQNFIINPGANVNITAGVTIKMTKGFKINDGALFKAKIDNEITQKSCLINPITDFEIVKTEENNYTILFPDIYESITWYLFEKDSKIKLNSKIFTIPTNLGNGQYTLYCQVNHNNKTTIKSTVITIKKPNIKKNSPIFDRELNDLSIFPNPFKECIHIEFNGEIKNYLNIMILDLSGKLMIKQKVYKNSYIIDMSNFSGGSYLLFVKDQNGNVSYRKLIKI